MLSSTLNVSDSLLSVCLKLPSQAQSSFFPLHFLHFSQTVLYFLCMCVSYGLFAPVCCISISHHFIILLCHWRLPLRPLLHKHFTSPPLLFLSLCLFSLLSLHLSVFLCVVILRGHRLICALLSAVPLCRWLPAVNPSGLFHTDTRLSSSSHHPLCQSHTDPLITIRFIRETVRKS